MELPSEKRGPARKPPAYRHFKPRNQGVVRIAGKDYYLGEYQSQESWRRYNQLLAEHFYGGSGAVSLPSPSSTISVPANGPIQAPAVLTIGELTMRYQVYANGYYQRDGQPTSEAETIKRSLVFLNRLYCEEPANSFTSKKLELVRESVAVDPVVKVRKGKKKNGKIETTQVVLHKTKSRATAKGYTAKIKQMFKWAVHEELVDPGVYERLRALPPLKKGRTKARETTKVRPVSEEHIQAVLEKLPPVVADMVRVQRLVGCRPQDLVNMCPADITKGEPGEPWLYAPESHKTAHHDQELVLPIGPKAQAILEKFWPAKPTDVFFSPKATVQMRNDARRGKGKHAAVVAKRPKKIASRPPKDRYNSNSYRRAVNRACELAGIPIWSPNRLRHSRLTEVRAKHGAEAARTLVGHKNLSTTEIYAEQDLRKAIEVAKESG